MNVKTWSQSGAAFFQAKQAVKILSLTGRQKIIVDTVTDLSVMSLKKQAGDKMANRKKSITETAKLIGTERKTLYRWIEKGLPHSIVRWGVRDVIRLDPVEVMQWLDNPDNRKRSKYAKKDDPVE